MVAILITLIPAHLLEFRYFTPGIVIAVINSPGNISICQIRKNEKIREDQKNIQEQKSEKIQYNSIILSRLSFSIFACIILNFITIYVFLFRSYTWVDGTIARFMY